MYGVDLIEGSVKNKIKLKYHSVFIAVWYKSKNLKLALKSDMVQSMNALQMSGSVLFLSATLMAGFANTKAEKL